MKRLALGAAGALVAATPVLSTTAAAPAQAASTCVTPDQPAPVIVSSTASDVAPGTSRGYDPQVLTIHADNPCGDDECAYNSEDGCTYTDGSLQARRTVGSGAGCLHNRYLDFNSARTEADGTKTYVDTVNWTDNDEDDEVESPSPLTNQCAGAYDTVTTLTDGHYDPAIGKWVFTKSQSFNQTRAFTVRRPSRLTANAGPEPVRKGRTVTVTGRLTRANWDVRGNPFAAYSGQSVLLQRRTLSGTYNTLKSVRTDRKGYLHTSLKALSGTRCYRFVFSENATTQGRPSGGDCVRAR